MKNPIFILFAVLLFSCNPQKTKPSEDTKETLKAFVEGETYAYMEKDYEKWASFWEHGDKVLRLDVADARFSQTRGWDKIGGHLETFFKEDPEPITSTFVNSDYLIFTDSELAWAAFDQKWITNTGEESVAKATVTLIKKDDSWKIISYTAIQYEPDSNEANTLTRE